MSSEEETVRRASSEYLVLQRLVEDLKQRIQLVSRLMAEVAQAREVLSELSAIKDRQETIVPFAGAVLAKVDFVQRGRVYLEVGGNVVVEREYGEALDFLNEREKLLNEELKKTNENYDKVLSRLNTLEAFLRDLGRKATDRAAR